MAAAPVYEKTPENFVEPDFLVKGDSSGAHPDTDFIECSGSSWTTRLCYIGFEEGTLHKLDEVSI